jgi:hypothetical protein
MNFLHRLLASAGLAALITPQSVHATLNDQPSRDVAHPGLTKAAPGVADRLDPTKVDRIVADALGGRRPEPNVMSGVLPGIVAQAVATAPPGARPEQVAAQLASRIAASLPGLDIAARANLASDIVAGVLQAFAARGIPADRVAVASAALAGISGTAGAPGTPLGGYTTATAAANRGLSRDVSDHDSGRNTAY